MSQNPLSSLFLQVLQNLIKKGGLLLLFLPTILSSQSSTEVRAKQKKLQAELRITQSNLKKLQKDRTANLSRFNVLEQQLKSREALISNIEIELDFIDADIIAQEADILLLKSQYDQQRNSFKNAVKDYQKFKASYTPLAFIFSSANITTAWKRLTFHQRMSRYHKSQLLKLERKEDELLIHLNDLKKLQSEKENSLEQIEIQQSRIAKDQLSKKAELNRIKQNEGFLQKRLKAQELQSKKLANLMTRLVEASIKKKASKKLPVEARKLNNAFGANKGKLPWPVSKGYVGKKFGKQRHPQLKMIMINNNGIDIVTEEGEEVLSVFDGKVMAVQSVAGYNTTILINHGSYFTVYANVDNVTVSSGEKVKSGQTLAYTAVSENGSSIHFELWKGKALQNPSAWLRKR